MVNQSQPLVVVRRTDLGEGVDLLAGLNAEWPELEAIIIPDERVRPRCAKSYDSGDQI